MGAALFRVHFSKQVPVPFNMESSIADTTKLQSIHGGPVCSSYVTICLRQLPVNSAPLSGLPMLVVRLSCCTLQAQADYQTDPRSRLHQSSTQGAEGAGSMAIIYLNS